MTLRYIIRSIRTNSVRYRPQGLSMARYDTNKLSLVVSLTRELVVTNKPHGAMAEDRGPLGAVPQLQICSKLYRPPTFHPRPNSNRVPERDPQWVLGSNRDGAWLGPRRYRWWLLRQHWRPRSYVASGILGVRTTVLAPPHVRSIAISLKFEANAIF